ncbi:YopX family protein [Fictibacillus nanhaiensis]|uniref:YopX family protein n=1 Tax=Fictibacillus nanhaiensis TaxID=742169 RepID=UPI002E1C2264|nr:YopX family protein [Fictibacillus nanhaiensis]
MNRLKFRAWGQERHDLYGKGISYSNLELMDDSILFRFNHFETDEPIIMQFTGVYDMNNKEAYENDIVIVHHMMVENIPSYKAEVVWDKYRFALRNLEYDKLNVNNTGYGLFGGITTYANLDLFGVNLNIIGNRYENPGLLKEGDFNK